MKKRVGILGGTFNPPHLGHLIIANEVYQELELDEVRFMPNHEPPHKKESGVISGKHRIEMLRIAIKDHPAFSIEPIELERKGKSFSFDTIQLLKSREPETEFFFIIGADMIEYLPKWHKIEELIEMVQFVGVGRPEYSQVTEYPVLLIDIPEIDISSTVIRGRIQERKSVQYLVPEQVISYIEEKSLYE
ncbi:nicotinate-nucleotide adenylyltransferase [Falsibacillus albus]|uniref:Probable nicotinate-nucleotide adenylyltransferase n=1 Tax=Falsibacillus albus TaxID=2478915 RepID=A0A3L7K7L8_9BACI|nr:nicotinate-nucleotide adenylyltransferase [Falsibacillus albus]RLQ98151.1 nicotinate-nucleotide adenylyltransferase [Falsibacillus albus]